MVVLFENRRSLIKEKMFIVTAALPYCNAKLHVGHLRSTYLPADIYARFLKSKGYTAFYVCGSDCHGTPILVRAIQEQKKPEEIVEYYHNIIKQQLEDSLIHFDIYSKTFNPNHYKMTQEFYERIRKNGYTYKEKVQSLYCPNCKMVLPDRLVRGTCPYCGAENQYGDYCEVCGRTYTPLQLRNPRCGICGNTDLEIKELNHVFFRLSELLNPVKKWLESAKVTEGAKKYALNWIKEGLRDWDISRSINWGVPIPGEKNLVFYVWFDAPIGYITFTKELFESLGKDWRKIWIEGEGYIVHFIGKDIIYHHLIFWPGMLIAAEFALPNEIRVRGFATLEGKKMSKSRRWYILLDEFFSFFDPEYLRWYWTTTTSESLSDGDFSFRTLEEKVNNVLIATIGNFIHRILSLIKRGNIRNGTLIANAISKAQAIINDTLQLYHTNQFDKAAEKIITLAGFGNELLGKTEPWRNLSTKTAHDVLFTCFAFILALNMLIDPILPRSARRLSEILQLEQKPHLSDIDKVFDSSYIKVILEQFVEQGKPFILFRKISRQRIQELLTLLKRRAKA